MPSKTYHVANREQGKAAQRDQSYRSCLTALLIFFFLCIILIIACKPWTKTEKDYVQHYQGEQAKKIATIPTTFLSTLLSTRSPRTTSVASTEDTTIENFDVVTEDNSKTNVKGNRQFDRYSKNTTTQDTIVSQKDVEDYTTSTEKESRTGTTREQTDVATTSRYNITDNVTDSDTTSMSHIPTTSASTNNVTIIDIIGQVTTFIKNVTDNLQASTQSDSDTASMSPHIPTTSASTSTNNVTIIDTIGQVATSIKNVTDNLQTSTQSDEETTTENLAKKFEKFLESTFINVTDGNTTASSTISTHSTNTEKSTSIREKSDTMTSDNISSTTSYNEFVNNTTDNIISSTTPIKLISVADNGTATTYKNLSKEFTTTINETSTRSYNRITTETQIFNETFNTTERHAASSMTEVSDTRTTSDFYNRTITTTISLMDFPTTTALPEDLNICETGHCKQITSKMLSYMNHSADPCDDFYEYACGGFEADPQLMDKDPIERSKNYQRIAMQMLKENRENVYSSFTTYYDSCVRYENDVNFNERIRIANDMLREIGNFYINSTWPDDYTEFTNLFAKLILHHSAFLFDVVPEVDEYRPNSLTLKIGPMMYEQYENPFSTGYMDYFKCSENEFDRKEQYVNLQILYQNYERCKKDTGKLVTSIKEALMSLNVFKDVNDDLDRSLQSAYVNKTVHVIDSVIMKGYFSHFPSKSEIQEAYSTSNYRKMSLEELQSSSTFLNWTQLISSLTTVDVSSKSIQVYFHDALTKGLQEMKEFAKEDSMGLNNALMGLYAHKLYNEMVLPRRNDIKVHCLEVATYLLRLEASSLYISSFTDNEITRMNSITKTVFEQLKKTLKLKTTEAKWALEKGRERLLRKIDDLELALPDVSYFKNRDLLYSEYNMHQITLYDNYFNNSMILLKRYRTLMYAELGRQIDSKQIWTYFATPFQSKARSIYSLNLIVIPYGIIDWSLTNDESLLTSVHYLLMANLGISIANQIAHHFDANGVHYWNQTRNIEYSLMHEHESTDIHFDEYVDCQKKNMYQTSMNMTLPFTDQTISFTIPQLTLNERLSDVVGLRLAYDTLALNKSDAEMRLPWMDLRTDQLFYLAYAQTYCTKTPLTSSFVSLYESENLPSRIRVFVAVSNNELVADAWNCRTGSQIKPVDICSVFPYIEFKVYEFPISV